MNEVTAQHCFTHGYSSGGAHTELRTFTFLPQATTTSLPAFSYLNLPVPNKENSALLLSAMLINNNVFFQRKIKGK